MHYPVPAGQWQAYVTGTVAIPNEAFNQQCSNGHRYKVKRDSIHVDEGDGGAMVSLSCGSCRFETSYHWEVEDDEFEELFGYPFGQRPEEEEN